MERSGASADAHARHERGDVPAPHQGVSRCSASIRRTPPVRSSRLAVRGPDAVQVAVYCSDTAQRVRLSLHDDSGIRRRDMLQGRFPVLRRAVQAYLRCANGIFRITARFGAVNAGDDAEALRGTGAVVPLRTKL